MKYKIAKAIVKDVFDLLRRLRGFKVNLSPLASPVYLVLHTLRVLSNPMINIESRKVVAIPAAVYIVLGAKEKWRNVKFSNLSF